MKDNDVGNLDSAVIADCVGRRSSGLDRFELSLMQPKCTVLL